MRLFPFAPLALVAALAGPAAAETFDESLGKLLGQAGGLTSDTAATRAAKNDVSVRRKDAEVAEARAGLDTIKYYYVPRAEVGASYTRLSAVDPLRIPAGTDPVTMMPTFASLEFPSNTYHLGATAAIPLTDLFLRLPPEKRSAQHRITAAETGRTQARLDASSNARVAYYEWVRAELSVVVAERMLAQVTANLGQVQALAAVDRVSRADVLRLEAQQAQAELAVAQVRELDMLRAEQLRIAMGAGPDEPLSIGEDVREVTAGAELPDAVELTKAALGRRLEGKALAEARAALAQHQQASRVDRLPKLNLFAQANYDNPNQRAFGSTGFQPSWAAGVQLTWNLNSFLDSLPSDRKYDAQLRALDADAAGLELGIRAQVTAARQAVVLADRAYAATQRGLAAAEESHRVRQELLAAERATAIELIDAETELTRARIAAIDALIDRRIARAQLAHVTGEDIP